MSQKKAQLLNPLSGNINVTGVITASSFSGDGSALAGIAKTDNIQTTTQATFLGDVSISGVTTVGVVTGGTSVHASYYYGDGSNLTGISVDSTSLKDDDGNIKVQANSHGIQVAGVSTFKGSLLQIENAAGTESVANFYENAAVELYYNNSKKFETTSSGINVTGNTETDTLKVTGVSTVGVVTDGTSVSASHFYGDGSALTGISAGASEINDLSDGTTDGTQNTGLGGNALNSRVNGNYNTAVGYNALTALTSGDENVAVGNHAADALESGSDNVAIGGDALGKIVSGSANVAIGHYALNNTTHNDNTGIGYYALQKVTDGQKNTAVGSGALQLNTASGNSALGYHASRSNTSGEYNTALGHNAGYANTTGSNNTSVGYQALYSNTASDNTGIGVSALKNTTTGSHNVAVGGYSLGINTSGVQNTSVGYQALYSNSSGDYNTALGYKAGWKTTNNANVFIGAYSGNDNTTGINNVAVGYNASQKNTVGGDNVSVGRDALKESINGYGNVSMGYQAGAGVTDASYNTFIGYQAGKLSTTGNNNIIIGKSANASNTSAANEITLGDSNVNKLRLPGISTNVTQNRALVYDASNDYFRLTSGNTLTELSLSGILKEGANVTAGKLSDNTNIDLEDGMVHLFTTTETTTATPNIRKSSSTSLNSAMSTGDAISVTVLTTAAAAGYAATVHIDGVTVGTNGGTLNWTGGSAPSDGGASGVDIYAYTIIKTASATYTVIASQTKTSA